MHAPIVVMPRSESRRNASIVDAHALVPVFDVWL